MTQHSQIPFGHPIGTAPKYTDKGYGEKPDSQIVSTVFRPTRAIVIPYWIRRALRRNKMTSKDAIHPETMGQILSYSDYAKFLVTQNILTSDTLENALRNTYSSVMPQCSSECSIFSHPGNAVREWSQDSHFLTAWSLCYSGQNKELTEAAKSLLELNDRESPYSFDKNQKYHRIELSTDGVFYIDVDPGILNALRDRDYAKSFISDYLKALYTYMPVHEACQQYRDLFLVYLYLL